MRDRTHAPAHSGRRGDEGNGVPLGVRAAVRGPVLLRLLPHLGPLRPDGRSLHCRVILSMIDAIDEQLLHGAMWSVEVLATFSISTILNFLVSRLQNCADYL